jgi:hypothetical protein
VMGGSLQGRWGLFVSTYTLLPVSPDTSLSQRIDGEAFKKPKKRARPVELHQSQDAV